MSDAGPRFAIIGAGFAARVMHLPGFKSANANVVAICDVDQAPAQRLAGQYGIAKVYSDWREMIRSEKPDAVSVCVPNVMHREMTLFALEAGCHVLCEKPLATSVAEAREMFDAARAAGRTLMTAQSWRFHHGSRAVRRVVEAGGLGEIYYGEATAMRRMGIPSWGAFHRKEASHGGALLDIGVHMLDLAVWLMGNPEPARVSAVTERRFGTRPDVAKMLRNAWDPERFDVDDFAVGLVRFTNGATLVLRTSWAAHIEQEQFSVRVLGTEAGATTIPAMIYRNEHGTPVNVELQLRESPLQDREMQHWVRVVSGAEKPLVQPEESINVQRILDAAYRSAEERCEVEA